MAFWRISNSVLIRGCIAMLLLVCSTAWAADGWRLAREDKERDIRVYLKRSAVSAYQDVYSVTTLSGNTLAIEAILNDAAAMSDWAARVNHARIIKREKNQVWMYIQYRLPYPLKPRDVVVVATRNQNNGVISIDSKAVKGALPEQDGWVRLTQVESRWRLTPLQRNRVKVELWGSALPGGVVPSMIYNYNLPDDAMQTFRMLRRMAQRPKYQS
ncbi:MAG: START domain-containing protein [Moraxellaceae bacterium]|nr:START domain-containing protein [Moraxellaceae bacterium]MDP1775873.1 START domain-containing protein [Moraxellaceae bacterium]MDZ4298501.1 START domain-containing protein [Moraxellaceae bacterium]MDZ4386421.1 START domain-containing protein [Moraxellaceae bacterium]